MGKYGMARVDEREKKRIWFDASGNWKAFFSIFLIDKRMEGLSRARRESLSSWACAVPRYYRRWRGSEIVLQTGEQGWQAPVEQDLQNKEKTLFSHSLERIYGTGLKLCRPPVWTHVREDNRVKKARKIGRVRMRVCNVQDIKVFLHLVKKTNIPCVCVEREREYSRLLFLNVKAFNNFFQ